MEGELSACGSAASPATHASSIPITGVVKRGSRSDICYSFAPQLTCHEAGALVPRGLVARTAEEARAAVEELGNNSLLSAQLLKRKEAADLVARSPQQAAQLAADLLRSSNDGSIVAKELYISQPASHDEVWYLAMTIDREACQPAIVISPHGGQDIRSIAAQHPGSIRTYPFSLDEGIRAPLVSRIASDLGLSDSPAEAASLGRTLTALHRIFRDREGLLLEVRSLARGSDGFTCADSQFVFDDDAHGRQAALFALRDRAQEVRDEVEAERHGLVYVRMEGDVGNVVNGAGLAMATNDAIGLAGGRSANFLDAGGQATTQTMMQAFGIVLRDERVKSILVNIYGGITRCDMIAESIIGAAKEMNIHVPMVVRLQGTNSEAGLKLLADANLGLHVESDFGKAAAKAVELAKA
ncbi:succinyl-CoA synthetase beta chain [Cordyceps fumosorosea ARSEF 2679]|uniref:Succinyl-CoA synthetase beta chain n=1 Tax=Cordyceps fumosorosea (strain ARSEF 2679) TaxID=1081104 RepID=A0A167S9I3_CORFA|nr:succinyl-CoA synthetase beta chain [Cordyceps fumosorosea ARSEF 2679]OAA59396.1 succinyl-CoA synthetase beta chain [Cordyceps fumosorosea ARSEF 2679]